MPLQKFRSIQDMNSARILTPADVSFERFLRHCARYRRVAPRAYPRGVFKFRSMEDAQVARRHGK